VAVASALPYLALKVVWLSGGALGVADRAMMHEPTMVALNAATAGMDVVGIMLALAFAHGWGARIPAWLLLPPMWVATGLLTRFVVGVPIAGVLSAVTADSAPAVTSGPVDGWVYVLVYIEFAGMGLGLMLSFFLYTRTRWAGLFRSSTDGPLAQASRHVQAVLANATATGATGLGVLYLAWAFGATLGLSEGVAARRTIVGSMINGLDGVLMMAGAAGVLMLAHRVGRTLPTWLPLSMAWVGSASLFGWGLWQTINVLGGTALMRGVESRALVNLVGLLRMTVGLMMGLLIAFLVAERHEASSTAQLVD
jgi:hypothetical protein